MDVIPERLCVFAKAPVPGRSKTRLAPALGEEGAAALHAAFVRDVVDRHARAGRAVTVWRAGDPAHPFWATLDEPQRDQAGGHLGARMAHALAVSLTDASRVVIIGTDSPTLPPSLVDAAFDALRENACVVGPAFDGGYYLIGARGGVPPVFCDIAWGTGTVLGDTLAGLRAASVRYQILPFWYDVDRPDDLALLRAHLPDVAPPPRHTIAALGQGGEA
ncbi:MAG: TIGR04282 family arsenosugar biosynthesis glycosyltransferase [Planctomycetota bacterium]